MAMVMENVLDYRLEERAGRVGVTYELGFGFVPGFTLTPLPLAASASAPCQFQPHEKRMHMQKESLSYARVNTAAAAAFHIHPDANVFLRLLQSMPLQLGHQLGERRRFDLLHIRALPPIRHVDALSSPTPSAF